VKKSQIFVSELFESELSKLEKSKKVRKEIMDRIDAIPTSGYGDVNHLRTIQGGKAQLWELRLMKDSYRVYFFVVGNRLFFCRLGNKASQQHDIEQCLSDFESLGIHIVESAS
jgi:putative component of toxin-antitoxin plasmid stabilization module